MRTGSWKEDLLHLTQEERYYLKLKVSYLFYIENRTQTEIASLLHLSRVTLNKMLKEARDEDIVSISVRDVRKGDHFIALEQEVCGKLQLKDVKIVKPAGDTQDAVNASVGMAAARYLSNLLKPGLTVGVGWGNTLQYMAGHIQTDPAITNLTFVSLIGGFHTESSKSYTMFANSLCENIAANYRESTISMLYAPLVVQNKKMLKAMLSTESIAETFEKMRRLDVAVVGIDGDPRHSTTVRFEKSLQEIKEELIHGKYAGNICSRFYTREGVFGTLSMEERIMSIPVSCLQNTPIVVGAAAGKHKVASIIGGSRAKLFNVLITDETTARKLAG
jgi:deoxyribonucleoside regulator